MLLKVVSVIATFTSPENIGATPQSLFWMLPLIAALALIYKTTNLKEITAGKFIRETAVLAGSIIIFIAVVAAVLYSLSWLLVE
ncbi:MAG: hypothetical protein ACYSRR_08300 [Planctomycetota bacterium]|jgi:hypothetical protein